MTKKTIIAIVGKSGSGKTTASKMASEVLNIPYICSFTTRKIRENEVDGIDHYFVRTTDMPPKENMLAYTFFGGHHYWATHYQVKERSIYVIDEDGLRMLKRNDYYNVKSIYISRNCISEDVDYNRVARDESRIAITDSEYDAIITNDGSLEELESKITSTILKLIYK